MRANRRIALALAGALLGAPAARADTETAPPPKDPGVDRGTRAAPGRVPEGRLKLGPFGNPYESPPLDSLASGPRFEAYVDVEDKAPSDPNETMQVWWRHFDLPEPAIYGRGINLRNPGIDLMPLVNAIKKKIKERKGSQ